MTTPMTPQRTLSTPSTARLETAANLKKAADAFEAIFTGLMLKSMRNASLGEGLLDNDAAKTFRDMQDSETARGLSARGSLGISTALQAFLTRHRPDLIARTTPHE
jgi:peptidoglycan hydrolase FlgJ